MRHNLNIRVSDKPRNGGVVACRTVSIREKLFTLLLGPKQKVMVVVPGNTVESIAITEVPMGGGTHKCAPDTAPSKLPSFQAMSDFALKDEKVKAVFAEERKAQASEEFSDEDWQKALELDKAGKVKNTLQNLTVILMNDPLLKPLVFNQLLDGMEIKGDVPWRHPSKFWRDADDAQLISYVDSHYGTFSARNYDIAVAKVTDDRSYHPIREFILQNEKYKGAALLQKCFTVDFLTKKRKVNEGEVPQYYVEHSHEPIITPEEFDKVQTELARRKRISRQYSGKSIFSSRIVCGDCGSYFGSKVWNSTSKYRRVIWQCNSKFKGEHKCETPHLDEETIKTRFVTALNAIIESKDNVLEDCRLMQATLTDCTGIDTEIESLLEEIDVVTELTKRCIAENSQTAQNQEEYAARYNGFVERYEKAKARLEQLRTTKAAREAQAEAIGAFMFEVQELDALTEFDEKLWLTIIDTITVHADERMTFKFQGGTEIEA